jgi:glycosyltransferase involved in cell wall biosynthesis
VDLKVSVVVPVFNAGEYIRPCIDSLLRQSLSPEEYEVIFVDDGSTDDSLSVLTEVARLHPHVSVIAMENSGWPGKPRNVGTDAATGEYVQYVDQDDYLGPEALERMYEGGRAARADVVVGKMVGVGRWTPTALFQRNRSDATLFDADLIASLTPHKMFRRAFLSEERIRFPEGKRRLEDFVFVMQCYVTAAAVAVVADYPCYYYTKRDDGKNTSFQRIDPEPYFRNLAEVVAVVDEHVEAGPRRDALLERFYR